MAATLAQAKDQLNIPQTDTSNDAELQLFVDAANTWVAAKVQPSQITANSAVLLGTLVLIDHLWGSQRGPESTPLSGEEMVSVKGAAYAIPNWVLEMLGPWLLDRAIPQGCFPTTDTWPDTPRRFLIWPP